MHIVASKDLKRNAIFSLDMLEMRLSSSARNTDSLRPARPPHDAANVMDREAARGWGGPASAPTNDAWQVDWRKCDACYLGLEPFVCLC